MKHARVWCNNHQRITPSYSFFFFWNFRPPALLEITGMYKLKTKPLMFTNYQSYHFLWVSNFAQAQEMAVHTSGLLQLVQLPYFTVGQVASQPFLGGEIDFKRKTLRHEERNCCLNDMILQLHLVQANIRHTILKRMQQTYTIPHAAKPCKNLLEVSLKAQILDLPIGIEPIGFAGNLKALRWLATASDATSMTDAGAQPGANTVQF